MRKTILSALVAVVGAATAQAVPTVFGPYASTYEWLGGDGVWNVGTQTASMSDPGSPFTSVSEINTANYFRLEVHGGPIDFGATTAGVPNTPANLGPFANDWVFEIGTDISSDWFGEFVLRLVDDKHAFNSDKVEISSGGLPGGGYLASGASLGSDFIFGDVGHPTPTGTVNIPTSLLIDGDVPPSAISFTTTLSGDFDITYNFSLSGTSDGTPQGQFEDWTLVIEASLPNAPDSPLPVWGVALLAAGLVTAAGRSRRLITA